MKQIKVLFLSFFLCFSASSQAYLLPTIDPADMPFDITNMVETTADTVSGALREAAGELRTVSDRIREAYQLIMKTEAVQTTINTYKNLVEVMKIYNKTVYLLNILEGNPGYVGIMRVAGDRDIRRLMGNDWSYMVDEIDSFENTFAGTDRRIRNAFNAFERGHLPYRANLIYIDPRLGWEKRLYEKKVAQNKAFFVSAHSAVARSEDKALKIDKMEIAADATDNPKERDSLRNSILINQYQEMAETNRTLAMILLQKNKEIKDTMDRRAQDKIMASTTMTGW
jgi:hypothetical protein